MGNGLAFAGVLGAVASVEETSLDGNEDIVIFAVWSQLSVTTWGCIIDLRFQKPISVAVDGVNGIGICDRNMIGLDSHQRAIFLVRLIYRQESFSQASLQQEP